MPTRPTTNDDDLSDADSDALPDWLRGLAEDSQGFFGTSAEPPGAPVEEPEESEADSSGGYPDWLSGLLDENAEFGTTEESDVPVYETQDALTLEPSALPDWFADGTVDNGPTPDTDDNRPTALPDWLSDTADAGRPSIKEVEASDLPDWLAASAEPASGEMPMDTELPDWLLGMSDEQESETHPEVLPAEAAGETPSWYETVADSLGEPAATEEAAVQSGSDPLIFSESELPDWLTEARALTADAAHTTRPETQAEAPTPIQPTTEPEPSADLPDWLTTADDNEGSGTIELPDWLRDMSQEGFQEQSEVPSPDSSYRPQSEPPEDSETTAAASESMALPAEGVVAGGPEVGAILPASPKPVPAELPEWLSGFRAGTTALGGTDIFSNDDVVTGEPSTEATQYESAAPTFAERNADGEEVAPSKDEPAEMPDWLRGLDISESQQPQAQAAIFEGDMPARAELPDWLQELMPSSSPTAGGTADIVDSSEKLVSADIPDWLQALRPEPSEDGGVLLRRVALPTPAEPEGPLEGLSGVLPISTLIDMPTEARVAADTAIPETVVAQAQLWQKLLEQPRSSERTVSHVEPHSETAVTLGRLVVAAALILGILGAFLLLPKELRLATTSPAQIAPGAPALIEGLNALQPGDRVIVAVEYGTAYAAEMVQIATPVLQQLAAQQAEIIFVSTLPEGVALGAALASEAEVPAAEAGPAQLDGSYLAGNAGGISAFLSQPGARAVRHILVLSSQPERLRWWIEQAHLAYSDAPTPVSLSVGASASVGPLISPYLRTLQVQGWLVGLPDALAYRELRNVEDPTATARLLDVLMLAHWAAGGLLIIGLLASLIAGKKGAH